jgi:hypothetical protein
MLRALLLLPLFVPTFAIAESYLVENGQARAEIVIPENPTRMQRVAAQEFRDDMEKISGAHLPIVTSPTGKAVKVFIGESPLHPVKAAGLKDGAYRIATGKDWIALVGDDSDFTPVAPWAKNNGDLPRARAEWEKIVGAPYGIPNSGLYKHRLRLPGDTGKPDGAPTGKNESLEIWGLDERGSFNAVTAFFSKLGARWYLPGPLGEVMPSLKTIPLPQLDETVHPDFPLRQFNFRFSTVGWDTAHWVMHLGTRNDESILIAHGMETMTNDDRVFAAHPDWFALYGGKRHYTSGSNTNPLCYSNEELFRETVRYARAILDTYHTKTVSIMPPDGYTAICQCEKCRGKETPERGERGLLSDYVWDFVNRVAKEVGKTHPNAKVLCCAYGIYSLPPAKIDKLEPNVLVCVVGGRRPINKAGRKAEGDAAPKALREAWVKKTDNRLLIFENYPFTDRGWYLPAFLPHALGDSVNATKGISQGEDIWLTVRQDFEKVGLGFNHFLVYFTARSYWGGPQGDVDAMFREYCQLFYGPAGQEMLAFFTYCEQNWDALEEDKAKTDQVLDLFAKAKAKAAPESVYAKRLAIMDDYLKGLRMKSQQLGQKRGPVPVLRLVWDAKDVVIDGKLDDDYWQKCPVAAMGKLRELQTGGQPILGTTFKAGWDRNSVYFAIRCEEHPGEKPNNTASRNGDPAIWQGDAVEIELATETHAYYQIAVSPSGAVVSADRGAPRDRWFNWEAKAEVATRIAEDHWDIEIRIPVTQDENDPLHEVMGRKPTESLPWHVNICRQRIHDDGTELSAFSPTGTTGFHEPLKFAYFYDGRSHQFEADPTVSDFVIGYHEASKHRKADPFLALANGKVTDLQKSVALRDAAAHSPGNAESIIAGIPIPSIRKTAQMENFLARAKAPALIEQFGEEDWAKWPYWQLGAGRHARGRAYQIMKQGGKAEADLTAALEWTSDARLRDAILLDLGQNREQNLHQDDRALETYRLIVGGRARIGGADEYGAVLGIARILAKRGQFDEALNALNQAKPAELKGVWRTNFQRSMDEIEKARGR